MNRLFGGNTHKIAGANNTVFSTLQSQMTTTNIMVLLFVLVLIGLAIYYYFYVFKKNKTSYTANNEYNSEANASNKMAELLFFHVDWCPHCKTAKPVWDDLKSQYEKKTINGYNVVFTEINCTNETPEIEGLMNKYSIEGFPTIKMLKDGQVIEYDAKPTKDTLEQFLQTVL